MTPPPDGKTDSSSGAGRTWALLRYLLTILLIVGVSIGLLAGLRFGGAALFAEVNRQMTAEQARATPWPATPEPLPASDVLPAQPATTGFQIQARVAGLGDVHDDKLRHLLQVTVTEVIAKDDSAQLVGLREGTRMELLAPADAVTAPISVDGRRANNLHALEIGRVVTIIGHYEQQEAPRVGKYPRPAVYGFVWRAVVAD